MVSPEHTRQFPYGITSRIRWPGFDSQSKLYLEMKMYSCVLDEAAHYSDGSSSALWKCGDISAYCVITDIMCTKTSINVITPFVFTFTLCVFVFIIVHMIYNLCSIILSRQTFKVKCVQVCEFLFFSAWGSPLLSFFIYKPLSNEYKQNKDKQKNKKLQIPEREHKQKVQNLIGKNHPKSMCTTKQLSNAHGLNSVNQEERNSVHHVKSAVRPAFFMVI